MNRWTGSWIAGPQAATLDGAKDYPGADLGLPAEGRGAVAGIWHRAGQVLIDIVLSWLVAVLLVHRSTGGVPTPGAWSTVVFAVESVVLLSLGGQTAGMSITGLQVVRVDRGGRITPLAALARTVLLLLLIPALFFDRDHRALHDRAIGAVVVRSR